VLRPDSYVVPAAVLLLVIDRPPNFNSRLPEAILARLMVCTAVTPSPR